MERRTKIFSVSLSPTQYQKLQDIASAMGSKQSSVVAWLIDAVETPQRPTISLTQQKTVATSAKTLCNGFSD